MMDFIVVLMADLMLSFITGIFVFLLWNTVVPDIFALPEITYLEAVGLHMLIAFLNGSKQSYITDRN